MPIANPASPAVQPSAGGSVSETAPVFYVRDKDGKLVLVPDITFEEYDRWWNRKEGGGDNGAPAFAFTSVAVTGTTNGDRVELALVVEGRIAGDRQGYVRVPLGLSDAFLRKPAEYEGDGDLVLEFQPKSGGYVAWIRGQKDSSHKLTMQLLGSIRKLGAERSTRFELPTFPTRLDMTLDMPNAVVEVTEASSKATAPATNNGETTRVNLETNGGQIELRWRPSRGAVAQAATVLEASCASSVRIERIEGRRRIRGEANLRVFSYGGPIETFDVRLPPDMEYTPTANPNFSIERLTADAEAINNGGSTVVRVKWQGAPTSGPIELRLLAESTKSTANGVKLEAAGFEVLDAARQWGHVDFVVDDEYAIEWLERKNARRVRDLPASGVSTKTQARFDYDRFPYSLAYRVTAQPARVFVDPVYVLYVRDKQMVLDATLNYTIQGSASGLKIDLADWTLDSVEPSSLVSFDRADAAGGPLLLTLKSEAFTTSPPLQIRVQAHRELENATVSATLPRLPDANPSPAIVAVVPADNVELTPRGEELVGLVSDPSPPQLTLGDWRQKPWFYRERAGEATARFIGDHRVRERMLTVESQSDVTLHNARADVRQTLDYTIDYEPISHVRLLVPKSALADRSLTIEADGEVLPYRIAEQLSSEPPVDSLRPIIVDLLEQRSNQLRIRLSYSLALDEAPTNRGTAIDLQFALPDANQEMTVPSAEAAIKVADAMLIDLREGAWRDETDPASGEMRFASSAWREPLRLRVTRLHKSNGGVEATLRRAWLQTWLAYDDRRDRASFRLQAHSNLLKVELPSEVDVDSVQATVDGESPRLVSIDDEGTALIGIPDNKVGGEVLLELWYRFGDNRPGAGWMSIAAPRLAGQDRSDLFFWQLILPRGEHLMTTPANMMAVQQWCWRGYYWERCATHDQRYLERWVGATSRDREGPPAKATNQYLFSSLNAVDDVHVLTAERSWLLLLAGGLALIVGLSLITFASLRRPTVLFAAAVVIVGLAFQAPELAAFVAQAAVVGLALVLLARWLDWALGRRYDRRAIVRASSIMPSGESKTTELQYRRMEGSSRGTTQSVPGALQISHAKQQA
ncbi:MAG: hypothetical protein KDA71_26575 [Planctomycetales bacterium]|nr:hypothetical protein [Planctomycetales bacterium]